MCGRRRTRYDWRDNVSQGDAVSWAAVTLSGADEQRDVVKFCQFPVTRRRSAQIIRNESRSVAQCSPCHCSRVSSVLWTIQSSGSVIFLMTCLLACVRNLSCNRCCKSSTRCRCISTYWCLYVCMFILTYCIVWLSLHLVCRLVYLTHFHFCTHIHAVVIICVCQIFY